jgi:hypothetical protein
MSAPDAQRLPRTQEASIPDRPTDQSMTVRPTANRGGLRTELPAVTLFAVNNLVNQLPALIGVIVGAVGTIAATTLADWVRWRRGKSVRWDERRLEVYAEYARRVKEIHLLTFRIAGPTPTARVQPIDRDLGAEMLCKLTWSGARRGGGPPPW